MSFQTFDAIQANRVYVSDVENLSIINGTSFVNPGPRASCRLQVNPESNPDPTIGGLMVPTKTQIALPLTSNIPDGLGIARPYNNDPSNCWTLHPDYITINKKGKYLFSFVMSAFLQNGPQCTVICQVLHKNDTIFQAAPLIAGGMNTFPPSNISPYLPFPIPYAGVGFSTCTSMADLDAGVELKLAFVAYPPADSPDDTVTIPLTSSISILSYTVE